MPRYRKPSLLSPAMTGHCAIEASAGTGKTYTLEHLIVDFLLRGLSLEKLLVVTFTHKATQELIARVRAMLEKLLALEEDTCEPDEPHWDLDDEAKKRLQHARLAFDTATISTIHGFCQQVLRDTAFDGSRLFQQELVASEDLFERAFAHMARSHYALREPALFQIVLANLGLEKLKSHLRNVLKEYENLTFTSPQAIAEAMAEFPVALATRFAEESNTGSVTLQFKQAGVHGSSFNAMRHRLRTLAEGVASSPTPQAFLEWMLTPKGRQEAFLDQVKNFVLSGLQGEAATLGTAYVRLVTLDYATAWIPSLLEPLRTHMEALKRQEGLYDFDDLITQVHASLMGPSGEALAARLRERYQVGLIDEFQDTDRRQWEIFQKIFMEGVAGPQLIVVGDPKQAIYGFRGGDLPTYQEALKAFPRPLQLVTNFRSTPQMIEACNELIRSDTGSLFSGANAAHYGTEVTCGQPDLVFVDGQDQPLPPLRLLPVAAGSAYSTKLACARQLAQALAGLVGHARFGQRGEALRTLAPEDVFVLTRSAAEGAFVLRELQRAGLPAALYRQEGLFEGEEIRACRDLLLAIDTPLDESRRVRALLGPFFGMALREAEACHDLPEHHPVLRRLFHWRELARSERFGTFFHSLVADSGVTQRLCFLEEGQRSLVNLMHLLELLQQEALGGHATLTDLARLAERWMNDEGRPSVEDSDVQRLEQERGMVQVMTMHKAKGLEAPVVALFGGLGDTSRHTDLAIYHEGSRRRAWLGTPKYAPPPIQARIKQEQQEEAERLLYVALTRAKAHLVLPCYYAADVMLKGNRTFDQDGNPKGDYGCLNPRLQPLLSTHAVPPAPPPAPDQSPEQPLSPKSLQPWIPTEPPALPSPDFIALGRRARPVWSFSFTSLAHATAGEPSAPELPLKGETPMAQRGPGGVKFGTQVHGFLEATQLSLLEGSTAESWMALSEVQALADRVGLEDRRRALGWIHAALTQPLALPTGESVRLCEAERLEREWEFLTPLNDVGDGLMGILDVLFLHHGKAYFLDWKTNRLAPDEEDGEAYGPVHLARVVEAEYRLQVKIYTLAVCRFLGIRDREDYEARYGGALYVFLRGLPAQGIWSERPDWATVQDWRRELEQLPLETLIPGHAGGLADA
ncbi:MAG: UvrD-helicase domain-containing protein [Firmicutes bacterium]|nr:UvrD-helicase domain-containing protein [Bacillota bacterium]